MAEKKVVVKQVGSGIRQEKSQRETLKCLGLGKIGSSRVHDFSPEIVGMLRKVRHLVRVEQVE